MKLINTPNKTKLVDALNKAHKRVHGKEPYIYDNGTIHFFYHATSIPLDRATLIDIAYEFFMYPEFVSILVQELLKIMPMNDIPDRLKEDYLNYRWKTYGKYYVCHSVHGVIIKEKDIPLTHPSITLEELLRD